METLQTSFMHRTVGEVVAEDYRRGAVFKQFGIDFCCGGGLSVADACERKGVDYAALEQALLQAGSARGAAVDVDPRGWPLDFLADYIVNVHHRYVVETLPVLQAFAQKVARVHGDGAPETVEVARCVQTLAEALTSHLRKEEEVLFPYVRALVAAGDAALPPAFGTARNPIRAMEHEHDEAGTLMARIRTLTSDYTPPSWACNTFRALYAKLEEFEADLHRHVHLENNVLFPATLALEEELAASAPAG